MKIDCIETYRTAIQPNVCIVRLTDSDGAQGLGETFYASTAVETYLHDVVAPALLSMDNVTPEGLRRDLSPYVGYQGSGVEMRAISAVDIAVWDLLARRAGLPLRELLGGPVRDSIPVYNTCAGSQYINAESRQASANWGVLGEAPQGDMEDLWAFLHTPGRLAKELAGAGFRGMKIWPFDLAAEASGGTAAADLRAGLHVLDEIRNAVGDGIDVYLELHALWTASGARRLLASIEQYDVRWVEDPIRPDFVGAYASLRANSTVRIAAGETLAGARGYKPLLDSDSLDVALVDLGWTGGLTEARRISDLAEIHGVAVAPHDCAGPVSLTAGVHWVTSAPTGIVQEMSRAFYAGWYAHIVDELPPISDGEIRPLDKPGLGLDLSREFLTASTTSVRTSGARSTPTAT